MSEVLIDVRGASKLYGNDIVLDRLTFSVFKGEIFGIIGASGSGKTTLLNLLIGTVRPEEGEIYFTFSKIIEEEGAEHTVVSRWNEIKKTFGFASQNPSFYPKLTAYENLNYFGALYGLSSYATGVNIKTLLQLMELEDHKDALAENLSGGMQKRLDIACSLIHDPHVLILDEPTSDLDPILRRQMWDLLKKINQRGTTIIVSSHFLEEIEAICDRIGILHQTKMIGLGTLQEIKAKFSRSEEINIETSPGNYSRFAKEIGKKSLVTGVVEESGRLFIRCKKAEVVLPSILKILDRHKETIVGLSVHKASLNEIFEVLEKHESPKDN